MTTCRDCGRPIVQRYSGTFFKPPEPMPMMWVHDEIGYPRHCGWAEPATPVHLSGENDQS